VKNLVLAAVAAALIAFSAATALAATTHHSCGNIGAEVTNLRATDTICAVARKVARAGLQDKSYGGFKCTARGDTGRVPVTCKKGRERVTYEVGD
jgi:hypothetical protein